MNKIKNIITKFLILLLLFTAQIVNANLLSKIQKEFDVKDFGAVGDGESMDHKAINRAIEAAYLQGGGIVILKAGNFLSGSIRLKSNVTLKIERNAKLIGAPAGVHAYDPREENIWDRYQDVGHSYFRPALIWAENENRIGVIGPGIIEGGGLTKSNNVPDGDGDKVISFKLCSNVRIENLIIKEAGHFAVLATGIDTLLLKSLSISTQRDGVNIVSSSNVLVEDCKILSYHYENEKLVGGDDALALKSDYSLGYPRTSENIIIRRCEIGSGGANAFNIGSETVGDFKNILIEDLIILRAEKAGIGITTNDGGIIDGITLRDIRMGKVVTPLYINVSDRLRRPDKTVKGNIRNILIEKFTAADVKGSTSNRGPWTASINGMRDSRIENIKLKDINIIYEGGGEAQWTNITPPDPPARFPPRFMGIRPAYGLFIRHAENVELENVVFTYKQKDFRPSLLAMNVDELKIKNYFALKANPESPDIILNKTRNFYSNNDSLIIKYIE
ncbi:MAG: right-handed parallel beta-helix repeat-containing protein [Melioribacteraceae bacterium]|nr:right-handed parallel beta-helix repeat-containing protein [Melioribacteraceae bacterium]MCF8264199.1 right-handed parallel beta-helix repeat-containing protein [Melioribacteraceae bacterium]